MTDLAVKYRIPAEVMEFVNDGFVVFLAEDETEKTVEFHIPAKRTTDKEGRITSYSVIWIHPDFNAEFCRYYDEKPGDLPNFYIEEDTSDVGSNQIDGIDTVDDLVAWLEAMRQADAA
jgi:hypothetical protein